MSKTRISWFPAERQALDFAEWIGNNSGGWFAGIPLFHENGYSVEDTGSDDSTRFALYANCRLSETMQNTLFLCARAWRNGYISGQWAGKAEEREAMKNLS